MSRKVRDIRLMRLGEERGRTWGETNWKTMMGRHQTPPTPQPTPKQTRQQGLTDRNTIKMCFSLLKSVHWSLDQAEQVWDSDRGPRPPVWLCVVTPDSVALSLSLISRREFCLVFQLTQQTWCGAMCLLSCWTPPRLAPWGTSVKFWCFLTLSASLTKTKVCVWSIYSLGHNGDSFGPFFVLDTDTHRQLRLFYILFKVDNSEL